YERQQDWQAAIADYTQTLQLQPKYIPAWMNRGNAYAAIARYEVAMSDFQQVTQLEPANAMAYANVGRMFKLLGKRSDAKDTLQLAAQLAFNQSNFGLHRKIIAEFQAIDSGDSQWT
ncbi:MAG: tetratricopeptide repeat protein, partial [Synechococcales bacterium]|nr:tetratricopeptide repeat protein [Synechococcales bacterium]